MEVPFAYIACKLKWDKATATAVSPAGGAASEILDFHFFFSFVTRKLWHGNITSRMHGGRIVCGK